MCFDWQTTGLLKSATSAAESLNREPEDTRWTLIREAKTSRWNKVQSTTEKKGKDA